MTGSATRFVGGPALDAVLADANLTRAEWNALAAAGEVPAATYAYPGAAKWRRKDVVTAIARHTNQTSEQETTNHD